MNHTIKDKLDRPIHDLRISVIDRCNFRCTYCMPPEDDSHDYHFLNKETWLSFGEITRLTKLFVQLGVSKVRITGGEPLLRPRLHELIHDLSNIREINDLALTTNGSLLAQNAQSLKEAGLKRLTISLDTLDTRLFRAMSGQKGSLNNVLEGIKEAERIGFKSIKINVVVQKGVNEHTILDLVKYFKNTPHVLRFIEYMDVGNCNHWQSQFVVPSSKIIEMIQGHYPLKPIEKDYFGEVASRYQFADGEGEVGFISSITQPFCRSCTRVRLTTDGQIYTCLFAEKGTDIRRALRQGASDETLLTIIQNVWKNRNDRYSELRRETLTAQKLTHKIEMFQIGG